MLLEVLQRTRKPLFQVDSFVLLPAVRQELNSLEFTYPSHPCSILFDIACGDLAGRVLPIPTALYSANVTFGP